MYEHGKSDSPVVPAKSPNNAASAAAEAMEERGLAKENTAGKTGPGHRAGAGAPSALDRVRQVAQQDKGARFTALLHHVSVDRLRSAFWAIRPDAAPGVDGVRWAAYRQDLEDNLTDLHERLHTGRYQAKPSRRAYIPKADGGNGRSASHRWRTRSSSGPSLRCSTRSTRWISWVSPMGFGRGAARMMRWTRSRSGSSGRR